MWNHIIVCKLFLLRIVKAVIVYYGLLLLLVIWNNRTVWKQLSFKRNGYLNHCVLDRNTWNHTTVCSFY